MASAAVWSASILLLAVAISSSISSTSSLPLTAAVKATDHTITKERDKAGVHRGSSATLKVTTAEEEGKKTGSNWEKAKKLDDDNDNDHDHDSDSDRHHDSDSDHDHDSDSDHDRDHDSDSDHDRDHDSDSDNDDDDDESEKKKKHAAQGRKGAPGGKRDNQLREVAKKV